MVRMVCWILVNFTASIIPCAIVSLFSPLIVSGYGSSFHGLTAVLNVSVYSAIFTTMSSVVKQYFLSVNRAWFVCTTMVCNVICCIGLFVLFLNASNNPAALSMVTAALITQFVFFVYWYIVYRNFQKRC